VSSHSGDTPAFQAAENGHKEVMRFLWKQKADLDRPALRGATPLYVAAQNDRVNIVRILAMAQVDLDRLAYGMATPLAIAAQEGHIRVVHVLLACKANVTRGADGFNAISAANNGGHHEVLRLLLDAEAALSGEHVAHVMERTSHCISSVAPALIKSRFQDLLYSRDVDGNHQTLRLPELEAAWDAREMTEAQQQALQSQEKESMKFDRKKALFQKQFPGRHPSKEAVREAMGSASSSYETDDEDTKAEMEIERERMAKVRANVEELVNTKQKAAADRDRILRLTG